MQENGKRQGVFLELVNNGEAMTPTTIGNEIGESRQTVKYHLDQLVEGGLVVRDGDGYRPQAVFTDGEFEEEFVDLLANLVPAVSERIELDESVTAEDRTAAVFNCIRMFVALELLEPPEPTQEGRSH